MSIIGVSGVQARLLNGRRQIMRVNVELQERNNDQRFALRRTQSKDREGRRGSRFSGERSSLVEAEAGTAAWFAVRYDNDTFAIFDAFDSEAGREAHLTGQVAAALMARADELLAAAPQIRKANVHRGQAAVLIVNDPSALVVVGSKAEGSVIDFFVTLSRPAP